MIEPPRWTEEELAQARSRAIELFREERIGEPLEAYLDAYDQYHKLFRDLLLKTADLTEISQRALEVLTDERFLKAFRYLPGPPISEDDLRTTADAVLTASRLKADAEMVSRIVEIVLAGLDARRFPWLKAGRLATDEERRIAVSASAALMAMRKLETFRRGKGKSQQEERVEEILKASGLKKVATREVGTLADAPGVGEFCRESVIGSRKADFIVGLLDRRIMPIECKVSNSGLNSIKRLNNDAAAKAEAWLEDFGTRNVVPTAVLSGVYNLRSLIEAQLRGLTLFWAHDLQSLISWIEQTRPV